MTSPRPSPGLRMLLALAWPVVLSRSAQAVIGFCDALMTAPLGENALAATTTGSMNTFAALIFPMGIAFIVQSFAAQLYGRGDLVGARRYGWYGLMLSAAAGVLALATIPLVRPTLGLLAYDAPVRELMGDYMSIRFLAMAAVVGSEALGNWYGGLGNTRLHMFAALATMVVNVFLNWLLIEGNLGAPALGVEGAAIASVVASWLGFAILMALFWRHYGVPRTSRPLELRLGELIRMLRFGLPNGVNWFLEFAAFMFFINVIVVELGTVTLAALMAVIQVNSVSFMPAFGLASAGAILVGQAIGSDARDDVPAIAKRTALVAASWQLGVGVFYVIFPALIMGWFAPRGVESSQIVTIGATLLALSAAWQLFDALAMTLGETLRAAGDTAWAMWARLTIAWVLFIPGAYLGVLWFEGGAPAAILSMVAYLAALAALLAYRFRSGAWRRIDLTGLDLTA